MNILSGLLSNFVKAIYWSLYSFNKGSKSSKRSNKIMFN